jgi:hypothetical protein
MDKESIFFTILMIWCLTKDVFDLSNYISPQIKYKGYNWLCFLHYYATEFVNLYNSVIFPICLFEDDEEEKENELEKEEKEDIKIHEIIYEVKFLEDIRKMNKEFIFTEEENKLMSEKIIEFYTDAMKKEYFENLTKIRDQFGKIEVLLTKYEGHDGDYCICETNYSHKESKEDIIKGLLELQSKLWKEEKMLNDKSETREFKDNILKNIEELAKNFVIDKRLEKIQNCNIMEYTPQGNVLMMYDKNKESFKFYSDSTIPYRYLEVVARKYVKQFNCRPIYVDMEYELKNAEERWKKERKEKEEKEEEEKLRKEEAKKNQKPFEEKKNVFAKFKSYNKESGTGRVPTTAPPKNTIPNKKLTVSQENEKVLLKQKANRFTYEGKLANFSFLKKTDRKAVDKKFATSFADFKKNILKK